MPVPWIGQLATPWVAFGGADILFMGTPLDLKFPHVLKPLTLSLTNGNYSGHFLTGFTG
jgi:hypothetical protein